MHKHFLHLFLIIIPVVIFTVSYLYLFPDQIQTKLNISSNRNHITEIKQDGIKGNGGENGTLGTKEEAENENDTESQNGLEKSTENSSESESVNDTNPDVEVGHYAKSGELEDLIWKIIEKTR